MRHILTTLLTTLLLSSCSTTNTATEKVEQNSKTHDCMLSGLDRNQELAVRFESNGCFHHSLYDLHFTIEPESLKVTGFDLSPYYDTPSKKIIEHPQRPLVPLVLSHRDIIKLDRLFEFYRTTHQQGCTTVDSISIEKRTGAKTVATESFTDGSCATYERSDLLTIPALVMRMEPKKPRR